MYVYKCIFFYIFPSIRLVSKLDAGKWRTITFVFDFRSEFCALSPDKDRIVISSNDRARMRVWRRFMRFCENIVTEMCYRLIHCCNEVRDSGFLSAPPRALRPVPHNAGRSARSCRRAARVTLTDGNPWRAVTVEKVVISRTANAHSRVTRTRLLSRESRSRTEARATFTQGGAEYQHNLKTLWTHFSPKRFFVL